MANLCYPIRNSMEQAGISHLMVLNACNSHLGKLKGLQKGEDKRGDGKVSQKRDTFKVSVQPGRVQFTGTADIVATFIAWHDAIVKANNIAPMEYASIPGAFDNWLSFAKVKEQESKEAESATTLQTV